DRNLTQHSLETLFVVRLVQPRQLAKERHVGWVGSLGRSLPARWLAGSRDGKFEDRSPRFVANDARSAVHESNDRFPHFFAGAEKAVVDAQLPAAIAD